MAVSSRDENGDLQNSSKELICPVVAAPTGSKYLKFTIYYRDSDVLGWHANLGVSLIRSKLSNEGAYVETQVCGWNSSNARTTSVYTSTAVPCKFTIAPGTFYHFTVGLSADSEGQSVTFIGIEY